MPLVSWGLKSRVLIPLGVLTFAYNTLPLRAVIVKGIDFHMHALFIRTSKFWQRLVVLKFLHGLSLNCF